MGKKKSWFLTCALLALILCIYAAPDASEWLTGTPMGSPSVDYTLGAVSETVNTPQDAFDEDFRTFYASDDGQYAWVGLDLGMPHVIDRVSFVPAGNHIGNMQLGVFEGANEADFMKQYIADRFTWMDKKTD